MKTITATSVLFLLVAASIAVPSGSASAASAGLLGKHSGYVITPAMMHAIDVIVMEEKKMRHRNH